MDDRKKAVIRLVVTVFLAASLLSFFSLLKNTEDTVTIIAKPQEEEEEALSPFDFLFSSPISVNSWFYGDKIIVASGNRMGVSARIFKLGEASIFSGYQKIAIIDVTENIDNREIEKSIDFESYLEDTFPVKKGHKYRFALYTMNPDKETEIAISIKGSSKLKTFFANRSAKKPSEKAEEKELKEEKEFENKDDSENQTLPPNFGNVVRLEVKSNIIPV